MRFSFARGLNAAEPGKGSALDPAPASLNLSADRRLDEAIPVRLLAAAAALPTLAEARLSAPETKMLGIVERERDRHIACSRSW
jgi:hypothetical protein